MKYGFGAIALLVLTACRPDTVELRYRFEEGTTLNYSMQASATARWNINGEGSGSYIVDFDVTETVQETGDGSSIVTVEMEPIDATEKGLPSPGLERRTFSLRVGPEGEVLEVLDVNGITAAALDHDELAFIGTYRPPLPSEPVGIHGSWTASRKIDLNEVSQQLAVTGELDKLGRDPHAKLAFVEFDGTGPLLWSTELPQGDATLDGIATTNGAATLDIERGFLRDARSTTVGDFDVRISPGAGRAPIGGTLHLELRLEIRASVPDS